MTTLHLRFTPDGAILIGAGRDEIQVWHVRERRLLHRQEGHLIGIDRDGHTFLMETPERDVQARAVYSGTPLALDSVAADDYPPGQRCRVRRLQRAVEIVDVITGRAIRSIALSELIDTLSVNAQFSAAVLSPDGLYLAVAVSDSTWGEVARGYCLRLDGKASFAFNVSGLAARPVLRMAAGLLLVETAPAARTVFDRATGAPVQRFTLADPRSGGQFFAVNEAERPPVIAFQAERSRIMLARSAVTLHSIVDAQAILDAAFLPDNRHLALLLESRTVVFYDWRSEQRVGSLFLM
ncbi:MAG: hypothetical protein ACUVS2_13665 [Candidatus Flexifilum sp.]